MKGQELQDIETDLLLESIFRRYGYDFRHYARASLNRRIDSLIKSKRLNSVSELIPVILRNDEVLAELLKVMSVTVTEMFRDPKFYVAIREHVIPYLETFPQIKIWHAGCATGEEVYSMAILLKELGLYDRCKIYATDYNNTSLDVARQGIYPVERLKKYLDNYNKSGSTSSFSDYYFAQYDSAKFSDELKKNVTFANHNLVSDGVFGEMNLIICRNVLIYFNKHLQNRVLTLFRDSLAPRGYLCLGTKESINYSSVADIFETIAKRERIYQMKNILVDYPGVSGAVGHA